MKRKDKYKLFNYAKNEYSKIFKCDYRFDYKSKKDIKSLLKEYPNSSMCYWSYCCYGLYTNCWQDPVAEGIWDYTQEQVNKIILNIFTSDLLKKCRTEKRMLYCEQDGLVHIIIIARDLKEYKEDYLFTFSKKESDWI